MRTKHQAPRSHAPTLPRSDAPTPQSAVALVITLVLLSVIMFMAITFLVVTRGDKSSQASVTDQMMAKFANDTAKEFAIADLIAPILAWTNGYTLPGLTVSTNYIRREGYIPGQSSFSNVNYDYYDGRNGGGRVGGNDVLQNITNLFFLPRAPVYVTNRLFANTMDARYYLDLNRNGRYETNGLGPVINQAGTFYYPDGTFSATPIGVVSNNFVGDPEWVGILERPGFPHSSSNYFKSRYAYIVIPISKTLDFNYIHNQAKLLGPLRDGFFRNQGVGSWELNLASFLADLNTNQWNYPASAYNYIKVKDPYNNLIPDPTQVSTGAAFDDALSLLIWRYNGNYAWTPQFSRGLLSMNALFGINAGSAITYDGVDRYGDGPFMTNSFLPPPGPDDLPTKPWFGANNWNHYFTHQDLFDLTKVNMNNNLLSFASRLTNAAAATNSYDRYTLYRMLDQIGFDSAPEQDKLNLNYKNVDDAGNVIPDMATNFIQWPASQFFTNVAIRLMKNAGYAVGTTANSFTNHLLISNNPNDPRAGSSIKIQIWPNNYYTPSVHRLFQLAANIYDATAQTNYNNGSPYPIVPTVFRPIYRNDVNPSPGKGAAGIYIVGFTNVNDPAEVLTATSRDLTITNDILALRPLDMVYGYPLVIGAKKGLPNFNEFEMQTEVNVTRKLEFWRTKVNPGTNIDTFVTNQMYLIGITNVFGVEAWNSYSNNYPRDLSMICVADMFTTITNEVGSMILSNNLGSFSNWVTYFTSNPVPIPANTWQAFWTNGAANKYSFMTPFPRMTNAFMFLTNSSYKFPPSTNQAGTFVVPYGDNFSNYCAPNTFPVPRWWIRLRARVRFILVDTQLNPPRIVDYVNLASEGEPVNITEALTDPSGAGSPACGEPNQPQANSCDPSIAWCTNKGGGGLDFDVTRPTYGVLNQIAASLGMLCPSAAPSFWNDQSRIFQVDQFRTNLMKLAPIGGPYGLATAPETHFNAPFQPTRSIYVYTAWQANDPLVHYMVGDLEVGAGNGIVRFALDKPDNKLPRSAGVANLGGVYPLPANLSPAQRYSGSVDPVNYRYEPWGGYAQRGVTDTAKQWAIKDSVALPYGRLALSDDRDFPTNKFPNIGWLGRVHRGTPWQSIYLKSAGVFTPPTYYVTYLPQTSAVPVLSTPNIFTEINTNIFGTNILPMWQKWSGNYQPSVLNLGYAEANHPFTYPTNYFPLNTNVPDAVLSAPTRDYAILDLFTTAVNDNASRGLLSVNQGGLAAWSAVLSGVDVLPDVTTNMVIEPAGVYFPTTTTNQLVKIVTAINDTRSSVYTNDIVNSLGVTNRQILPLFPGKVFHHKGDILRTPELSIASPYLSGRANLYSDEVHERIAEQILGLVKLDQSPRFVIYAYGQALKPAEHSLITSGTYFGVCTNYQVTAESATRSVVRIEGLQDTPPHPHVVIESFNVLPPD